MIKYIKNISSLGILMFLFGILASPAFGSGTIEIPTTGTVTQPFLSTLYPDLSGNYYDQNDQLQGTTTSFHDGVDISAGNTDCTQNVSPVYAAAAGTVIWADYDASGFGWSVRIDSGKTTSSNNKYVFTLYGHMGTADVNGNPGTSCIVVLQNQTVTLGQLIGYQGTSGNSTGVHLHWSVLANPNVDSFSDSNTVWASPDFYSCIPLTVQLNNNPSPTSNVVNGENFCWTNTSPSATQTTLTGISAASTTNIWATGWKWPSGGSRQPITYLSTNGGSSWTPYSPPGQGFYTNHLLHGIATSTNGDAWTVGTLQYSPPVTLAYRWNGYSWSLKTSDNPSSTAQNELNSVGIDSSGNIWAVGDYGNPSVPLLEEWNGTKLANQNISLPSGYTNGSLESVAFSSSTNGWIVGTIASSSANDYVFFHYDGTSWTPTLGSIPALNNARLQSVTTISDGEAWAVGDSGTPNYMPLIMHYTNANGWQQDTSYAFPSHAGVGSISASGASAVWAAGTQFVSGTGYVPFTIFYNGSNWTKVSPPSSATAGWSPVTQGITSVPGYAWLAGQLQANSQSLPNPLILSSW